MKGKLTTVVGAGVLGLSMALVPLTMPASAQTGSGTSGTGTNNTGATTTTTTRTNDDNSFDWGWLGLLGLAGLAGLAGRNRHEEPTRYRDPNTTVGTTTYNRD